MSFPYVQLIKQVTKSRLDSRGGEETDSILFFFFFFFFFLGAAPMACGGSQVGGFL